LGAASAGALRNWQAITIAANAGRANFAALAGRACRVDFRFIDMLLYENAFLRQRAPNKNVRTKQAEQGALVFVRTSMSIAARRWAAKVVFTLESWSQAPGIKAPTATGCADHSALNEAPHLAGDGGTKQWPCQRYCSCGGPNGCPFLQKCVCPGSYPPRPRTAAAPVAAIRTKSVRCVAKPRWALAEP
jgi:hypothetical protein